MNYYELSTCDQQWNNWLVFTQHDDPPVLRVREKHRSLVCPACRGFDYERLFRKGFVPDTKLRAKGDIMVTLDGFFCVNDKVRKLIARNRVRGIALKKTGDPRWNAVNITHKVNVDKTVYEWSRISGRTTCRCCNRGLSISGLFEFLRQVEVPDKPKTFFTPAFEREGGFVGKQDIFVTEDIVDLFKKNHVKGGVFRKLLSEAEELQLQKSIERGKERWPSKTRIIL